LPRISLEEYVRKAVIGVLFCLSACADRLADADRKYQMAHDAGDKAAMCRIDNETAEYALSKEDQSKYLLWHSRSLVDCRTDSAF